MEMAEERRGTGLGRLGEGEHETRGRSLVLGELLKGRDGKRKRGAVRVSPLTAKWPACARASLGGRAGELSEKSNEVRRRVSRRWPAASAV